MEKKSFWKFTFRWIWMPLCNRAITIVVECLCNTTVLIVVVDVFGVWAGILSKMFWPTEFTFPKGVDVVVVVVHMYYQRVGEAQPPFYFLKIRPFSVAVQLPPLPPSPRRQRSFQFPPEIVLQNAVEHSVTSPAYRLRQIDIPVKLLLSPCKLCCPSLQCSFVVISLKTLGMT